MAASKKAKVENKSFLKDLIDRRVPQALGIYLGASWAIVQFVDFLVNRYVLSPYLIDMTMVIFLSFIPTILLMTYFHGKPGRDSWTRTEIIGIPLNVIVTISLLFFFFNGKELGAASETVTVQDEDGNKIERVIPKSEFRKKLLLFFFDNKSGNAELDWLQYGFSFMIGYDLSQDIFLDITTVHESGFSPGDYYVYRKIKDAGFSEATGIPLALKRKVANDFHLPYFTSGTFKKVDDNYLVEMSLYETKNSKLVNKQEFTGADIFALADEISVQLKTDLEVPTAHIHETNDLPVAEILTTSVPAFKSKTDGLMTLVIEQDWRKAQASYESAIKEDPTFAAAYTELIAIYVLSNQNEKRVELFQPLMQHLYKLPERVQYMVKSGYYDAKQQPEKQLAVVKMLVNIYPDYLQGHYLLAVLYGVRNQRDEQLAEFKKILEIDPERYETLQTVGLLYQIKGEFDAALKYFNQYASRFPDDPKSFTAIGGLHKERGDYQQAKTHYEKALLLDPISVPVQLTLAQIDLELGNFEQAFEQFQEVLTASSSPQDKMQVYHALEKYYLKQGQINQSIEYMHLKMAEMKKFAAPLLVLFRKISTLDSYVIAGQEETAFKVARNLESELQPPYDLFASFGYMTLYLELEDADKTEEALQGVETAIETLKWEVYRPVVLFAQGRVHEFRAEYEEAIADFQKQLELSPTDVSTYRFIGRCYRKLNNYDEAGEYLQKSLKIHPFGPSTNYELALLYSDMGETEKAIEHLRISLDVWKNADPEYKPAKLAREKLAELQA